MDDNAIVQRISQRQQQLRDASVELKSHFVGLDEVIDKILLGIEAWFCTPEVVTRPTVVCLWGLTGIGKTDLVRRLVKSLNFMDSFVEIQMTNKGSSQNTYASTLQSLLSGSNVCPEEPGVLLLDEIQRFRSVDQEGKDIHDYMFQDLWMLLSGGRAEMTGQLGDVLAGYGDFCAFDKRELHLVEALRTLRLDRKSVV